MKKRILVIMPSMFIGGAERSLIGLLDSLNQSNLDVYLFLFRHEGELLSHIPSHVHLLPQIDEYTTFDRPIIEILKSNLFKFGLIRIWSKILLNIKAKIKRENKDVWKSMQYTSYYVTKLLPEIEGNYDMAISFLGVPFYMKKVHAKKKMAWIHTDYDSLFPDRKKDIQAYQLVDYIVTVSDKCKQSFDAFHPSLINKSIMIENIISKSYIFNQTNEIVEFDKEHISLLSIGRFCDAKNFDNVPNICRRIREYGLNVKWYLIGYGGDENLIRSKILQENMQDYVIILGKKNNPYPYIKACDIYIQPSRYEGKAVTVREAQIMNKPVIITNYSTSKSQLIDGCDGIIVPMDNENCAKGIVNLLKNKMLQHSLIENTRKNDYTNEKEIEKILKILEE